MWSQTGIGLFWLIRSENKIKLITLKLNDVKKNPLMSTHDSKFPTTYFKPGL